jgi:hypothetical protein
MSKPPETSISGPQARAIGIAYAEFAKTTDHVLDRYTVKVVASGDAFESSLFPASIPVQPFVAVGPLPGRKCTSGSLAAIIRCSSLALLAEGFLGKKLRRLSRRCSC